jgi:hypothetical protein
MMPRRAANISGKPGIKRILVRCAATAKLHDTGLTVIESEFATTSYSNARVTCEHCKKVHYWTTKDVVLAR